MWILEVDRTAGVIFQAAFAPTPGDTGEDETDDAPDNYTTSYSLPRDAFRRLIVRSGASSYRPESLHA